MPTYISKSILDELIVPFRAPAIRRCFTLHDGRDWHTIRDLDLINLADPADLNCGQFGKHLTKLLLYHTAIHLGLIQSKNGFDTF